MCTYPPVHSKGRIFLIFPQKTRQIVLVLFVFYDKILQLQGVVAMPYHLVACQRLLISARCILHSAGIVHIMKELQYIIADLIHIKKGHPLQMSRPEVLYNCSAGACSCKEWLCKAQHVSTHEGIACQW